MVFTDEATARAGLFEEVRRYLDLVDAIRAIGREPIWTSELGPSDQGDSERRTVTSLRGTAPRPRRFTV